MPPAYVKTIREEILYEYAKLISRSAYKSLQRPFITDRFKKLRDGEITISGTIREWEKEQELPKECVLNSRGRSCRACLTLIRAKMGRQVFNVGILRMFLILLAEFGGKGDR